MAKTTVNLTDTVTNWVTKTNDLSNTIGDLANLNTTVDSDVVGAINELKTKTDSAYKINNLETLYNLLIDLGKKGITCLAQIDDKKTCATCTLCWSSKKPINFITH